MDIYESQGNLIVKVAVPGAKKEEISIEIKDQILHIDAEHKESHEEKKEKEVIYHSQKQGSFHYTTALPKEVEKDKARAKLEDGILKITIPLSKKGKKGKGIVIEEGKK